MSQQQLPHSGITCHLSCLSCRRVMIHFGAVLTVAGIRTLMIEGIHTAKQLMQGRNITCITAVGITACLVGRHDQHTVGYYLAFLIGPVCPILDIIYLTHRYAIHINHVSAYMRQCRFLPEEETTAWHTMTQRYRLNRQTMVFIDYLIFGRIYRMEFHLKFQASAEQLKLFCQHCLQFPSSIYMQRSRTSKHTEGRYHADKAEAMVAVQMGDKHLINLGESEFGTSQLHLCTFATVYHHQFLAYFHHLR